MKVGMSDEQWTEFGSVLKEIHFTRFPSDIARFVRREDFVPKWSRLALDMQKQVDAGHFDDPYQKELGSVLEGQKGNHSGCD